MSYALGAVTPPGQQIRVGNLVETDPIMSTSSLIASRLILRSIHRPQGERLGWLSDELNKAQSKLGEDATSKVKALMREGKPPNQALFDGLRLTLANFFAKKFEEIGRSGTAMSGLGESVGDINAVFCGVMGTVGTGGGVASTLLGNPDGTTVIGTATAGMMGANSCNAASLREMANLTNAQAALAAAQGNLIPPDKTVLYVGLGLGAVVAVGALIFVLKK